MGTTTNKSAKSTAKTQKSAAQKPTVRAKIEKLDALHAWFMGDEFELDQATTRYQEAMELAQSIEKDLQNLKNEIEVINQKFGAE